MNRLLAVRASAIAVSGILAMSPQQAAFNKVAPATVNQFLSKEVLSCCTGP
jgi:hypothetical protein